MSTDKKYKLILSLVKRVELVPEEYREDPMLRLLYLIYTALYELRSEYAKYEDYLYMKDNVDTEGMTIDVVDILKRSSTAGFITNDGTDTIKISINMGEYIDLNSGETFEWGGKARSLLVRKIQLKASSGTQAFRLFAV